MQVEPLVSVVIPTYNQEAFIQECLDSVINQSYGNLEIICTDDGSTDRTVEMLQQIAVKDSRVKVLTSDTNKGIPANFNRGFDHCTGTYIAFHAGDDVMLPGKIEKCIKVLEADANIGMVMHDTEVFNDTSNEVLFIKSQQPKRKVPTHALHWWFTPIWTSTTQYAGVIPSACVARSSYYLSSRYSADFRIKHEILFYFENHMKNPGMRWEYIPEVLCRYRVHDDNYSMDESMKEAIWDDNFKMVDFISKNYPSYASRAKNALNHFVFTNLLNRWDSPTMSREELKRWFRRNAGFGKYIYLLLMSLTRKLTGR